MHSEKLVIITIDDGKWRESVVRKISENARRALILSPGVLCNILSDLVLEYFICPGHIILEVFANSACKRCNIF